MKKFAGVAKIKVSKPVVIDENEIEQPSKIVSESINRTLKVLKESLDLTESQFKELTSLKFPSNDLIISPNLSDVINAEKNPNESVYEIIALIKQFGFVETVAFLKKINSRDEIMFSSPFMEKSKIVATFEKDMIRDLKKDVVESGIPCSKCHQKKVEMMAKQTRSADEPMTVFYQCNNPGCGHQWRSN